MAKFSKEQIKQLLKGLAIALCCYWSIGNTQAARPTEQEEADSTKSVKKIKDIVIYQDSNFFSTFPSVIKMKNGEYLVAFRRAPERRKFGEKGTNHVDPNSYLMGLRSKDGIHWQQDPALIYAYPFGGSQDPCLLQLRDGSILCASYAWSFLRPDGMENLRQPYFETGGAVFLGGYLVRSLDDAKTWKGPYYPPHIKQEINYDAFGKPIRVYNRGALCEGKDGRVFWVVTASNANLPKRTSNYLMVSEDKGISWQYASVVAEDSVVSFNETSIYETPKGDLVAFLRTANLEDEACMARSIDGGKSFGKWQKMGFKGHPLQAIRLNDNRVLLVYGYRHKPFGIRARILNAECTDFRTAPEIVLRDDGGTTDLGYPWAVTMDEHRVLVVYYYNLADGPRHIAGTILEINSEN